MTRRSAFAASDAVNDFTRAKMREDGFFRRIKPNYARLAVTDRRAYDKLTGQQSFAFDRERPKRRREWERFDGEQLEFTFMRGADEPTTTTPGTWQDQEVGTTVTLGNGWTRTVLSTAG